MVQEFYPYYLRLLHVLHVHVFICIHSHNIPGHRLVKVKQSISDYRSKYIKHSIAKADIKHNIKHSLIKYMGIDPRQRLGDSADQTPTVVGRNLVKTARPLGSRSSKLNSKQCSLIDSE